MSEGIRITYTAGLMRRVVRAYWWRSMGLKSIIAVSACGVPAALGVFRGDRSWVVGVFGAFAAIGALVSASIYRAHLRNALDRVERLDDQSARLTLSDEALTFQTARGTGNLPWTMFKEAWIYEDFWLLMLARNEFITLPTRSLELATLSLVTDMLRKHGARIR